MGKAEDSFKVRAPGVMRRLMADFRLSDTDAAAIMGNAGHESLGMTVMQEIKPSVPGSRGGWGWFQWTGPRRRDFEAFAKSKSLDPASDEANYQFLKHELETTEARAIGKLKAAGTLRDKTIAFEEAFERAGVKAYDARVRWAEMALSAYKAGQPPVLTPVPPAPPVQPPPAPAAPDQAAPVPPGSDIAKWVIGAAGALIAALAAWLMKG